MREIGIRFRIIEPMMFRKSGEFDPSSRGFQSSAQSLLMPTPSTVVGAISTSLMKGRTLSETNWVDEYLQIIGMDSVLRGPYLIAEQRIFVEDRINNVLLELTEVKNEIEELCRAYKEGFLKIEKKGKGMHIGSFIERVGIGLTVRAKDKDKSTKIAKEGLLYSASFVDYSSKDMGITSVYLHMDVRGSLCDMLRDFKVLRLGGEERVALLGPSTETIVEKLRRGLWESKNTFTGKLTLFLISPALFRSGKKISVLKEEIKGHIARACKSLSGIKVYGRVTLLGAGYSLSKGGRKPIFVAIEPGTLILVDVIDCNLESLYWNGIGEVGREIGYGSLLPVPIADEEAM